MNYLRLLTRPSILLLCVAILAPSLVLAAGTMRRYELVRIDPGHQFGKRRSNSHALQAIQFGASNDARQRSS